MKYVASVFLVATVALLVIWLRHETSTQFNRIGAAELNSGEVGRSSINSSDGQQAGLRNDHQIQLSTGNSVSAVEANGAKLTEKKPAELRSIGSTPAEGGFIAEEGTALPPDTFANVFSKNWVEGWFKGRCASAGAGLKMECLLGPANAIAVGPSADEDEWTTEAIEATTKAADAAMQSRKGSDYRFRCNKSGCLLVFATPIAQPSVKGADLPGFYEFFSDGERIHWTACFGCSNASYEVWLVVRDPPTKR